MELKITDENLAKHIKSCFNSLPNKTILDWFNLKANDNKFEAS